MANSPSQKWEDGRLVERAIETNRWKVLPDGSLVEDDTSEEAAAKPAKKAVSSTKAENKSVKQAETK